MSNHSLVSVCLVLAATCAGGCSEERGGLVPVQGVVLLDGQPLSAGTVVTTPEQGAGARGVINIDGTFELETRGVGKGAQVGKHFVAVMAYESSDPGNPEAKSNLLVPRKYTNPYNSGLVLDIPEGGKSDARLELSSK